MVIIVSIRLCSRLRHQFHWLPLWVFGEIGQSEGIRHFRHIHIESSTYPQPSGNVTKQWKIKIFKTNIMKKVWQGHTGPWLPISRQVGEPKLVSGVDTLASGSMGKIPFPRCFMYGMFSYSYPINVPNVVRYSIHGAFGVVRMGSWFHKLGFHWFLTRAIVVT